MNYQTDKSLSIGGNLNIGGGLRAGGNAVFARNVRIEGWLDAKNIKGPMKGLFASEADLRAAFPRPQPGWYALVGDNLPAALYCTAPGDDGKIAWTDTGQTAGEFSIFLDQVEQDMESLMEDMLHVKDKTELIDEIGDRLEAIEDRVKKDAQGQVDLSDIGEISQRYTTSQLPSLWRVVIGDKTVGVLLRYSDPFGHAVVEEMHTSMVPGESGCLTAADLDSPARVYSRSWCRQKETWTPWEESPRMSHVAEKADKGMFVTLSEEEYDALPTKDSDTYYYIYEDED